MPLFDLRDHENRIREVQLVYREVVPRLFDPPDRWNKAIFLIWSLFLPYCPIIISPDTWKTKRTARLPGPEEGWASASGPLSLIHI